MKMRCKLEGQPIPEVNWYFNDNLIQSGNDYTIFSDLYEFFLMIPRSTLDMSGKYSVRAKNKYGEMECNTTLTVEGIIPFSENFNQIVWHGIVARTLR